MSAWTTFSDAAGRPIFTRPDGRGGDIARRFRFDVAAGLDFELSVGCGINTLIEKRQVLLAVIKGLFVGFRKDDPKVSEADIKGQLQVFLDSGGDFNVVYQQLIDALNDSGTFGRKAPVGSDTEGVDDPQPPATA